MLPESVVGYGSLTLVILWMICDVIIYPSSLTLHLLIMYINVSSLVKEAESVAI